MKGQGKIKYWFTKNGVHVPVYEKYTTRKGVEPDSPKAKFKKGTKKESFNTEESIKQKTTKVQEMEDEFKPTTSMSIHDYKLEDKKWGRRQGFAKFNRELENLESGIAFMSENFGDIRDLTGNIYLRNGNNPAWYDPEGINGRGRATYFGTSSYVDEGTVVHEMTHAVTTAIAKQYKKLGYKSEKEVYAAMRSEIHKNLGKAEKSYDGRKHDDRPEEYLSNALEGYGEYREHQRAYKRDPEGYKAFANESVNNESKEALKVIKKYYKQLGRS